MSYEPCENCDGCGYHECMSCGDDGSLCSDCDGEGSTECPVCKGDGATRTEEEN